MVEGAQQARILIVSGSPYTRYVVSGQLGSQPDLFVVGTARTPDEIAYKKTMLRPDLLVVDIESPNDLSDLQRALAALELPVLALCAQTRDGAELAFAALEAGVADVLARADDSTGGGDFVPDLLRKVRGLARARPCTAAWHWNSLEPRPKASARRFLPGDCLIVVSASIGGLGPLVQLLLALPPDLKACLLALAPLPACYLRWFLRRIDPAAAFYLRQARDGLPLNTGVAYLAPSEYQLVVGPRGFLSLDHGLFHKENWSSADATMSSLATRYGPAVLVVVLSGTGRDGVKGALDVRAAGGAVIAQETTTCVVEETPRAVIEAGAATVVLPPEGIADEMLRRVPRDG